MNRPATAQKLHGWKAVKVLHVMETVHGWDVVGEVNHAWMVTTLPSLCLTREAAMKHAQHISKKYGIPVRVQRGGNHNGKD